MRHRVARELLRLGVGDRESMALVVGDVDGDGRACRRVCPSAKTILIALRADASCAGSPAARRRGSACRRRTRPGFTAPWTTVSPEAVRRRDEHDLVEARLGVEREHHARGTEVAAHHPLDAGRQRDVLVRESLVDAIGDRAVVVEARKYLLYCMKNIVQAIDIKKCFLLAGERRVGQVLGGRRRAHRPGRVRRARRPAPR